MKRLDQQYFFRQVLRIVRTEFWGGLRGGIPVALALSLPAAVASSSARANVLALTYCVVVFSILVQGLTIGRIVRRALIRGD